MKTWPPLLLASLGVAAVCVAWPEEQPRAAQQNHKVEADRLELRASRGVVVLDGLPYSGEALRHDDEGHLLERVVYREGKKHGLKEMWFEDGTRSFSSTYVAGKRHGETRSWWRNGNQRTLSKFVDGRGDGTQLQWYASGAMFKQIELRAGTEAGLQRSWRENGKLYNNYEVHDGRIYGLKRSKLCFRLDDEEIQISQ